MPNFPALILTVASAFLVVHWLRTWRRLRADELPNGHYALAGAVLAGLAAALGVLLMFEPGGELGHVLAACPLALQLPILLIAAAVAAIATPKHGRRAPSTAFWVIAAASALALTTCFTAVG